jgi:hypothetical protein
VPGIQGEKVKHHRVTMGSVAVSRVREAARQNPGKTAEELATLIGGYKRSYVVDLLVMLHNAGETIPVKQGGNIVRWWPAELASREIERLQAERRLRRIERQKIARKAKPYTKQDRIRIHGPAVIKLLALIESQPGITSQQMADAAGYALSHTKNVLAIITGNQKALPVPAGVRRCWYLYDEAMRRIAERDAPKIPGPPTHKQRILEMAKRDGGVSSADIMREIKPSLKVISRNCPVMVKAGILHKSYRIGARARWFDSAERAAAWASMPPLEPNEYATRERKPKPPKPPKPQKPLVAIGERIKSKAPQPSKAPPKLKGSDPGRYAVIKAKPALPAPVSIKIAKEVREVDYSKAKITICPSPKFNYRHEYVPGSEAWTGFAKEWQQLRGRA